MPPIHHAILLFLILKIYINPCESQPKENSYTLYFCLVPLTIRESMKHKEKKKKNKLNMQLEKKANSNANALQNLSKYNYNSNALQCPLEPVRFFFSAIIFVGKYVICKC